MDIDFFHECVSKLCIEGASIFKEMVQNADDAGATEVNFCLDYRQHASDKLAYTKLEPFQGMHSVALPLA